MKCFSISSVMELYLRFSFFRSGLKSTLTDLNDGTIIHCWVPKTHNKSKPNLLLIHGFGSDATWQWNEFLSSLATDFNLYIPDLIFFGSSYTTRPDRSESFQAKCVMAVMDKHGVKKMNVVGVSYGGFVTYSLAAQFPERMEKLVFCCSGVCMEEKDMEDGMFRVKSVEEAENFMLPQTTAELKELIRITFADPKRMDVPAFFLNDLLDGVTTKHREEKKELIQALHKDRKFSNLPRISQPTLIIWGEKDVIFPMELAHRLKSHVGEDAELVVIKDAGHAVNIEKPKEICKHLKSFLVDPLPPGNKPGHASNGLEVGQD